MEHFGKTCSKTLAQGQVSCRTWGVQISKRNTHVLRTSPHVQHNDHHMSTQCPRGQGSRLEGKGRMAGTKAMEPEANEQLLNAAEHGRLDEVRSLLWDRADLESRRDDDWEQTPLHLAVEGGHRDVVQLLLEKNARIETTDRFGTTPLHLAVIESQIKVAQLLLEKNAQIETTNNYGETPLSHAIYFGHSKIVDVLLEHILKREAWSWSLVCEVMHLDNQEQVVKILDMWPQKAFVVKMVKESMKRAQLPERLRTVLAPLHRAIGEDVEDIGDAVVHHHDLQLGDQNLFWSQEVAVTLKVLPGIVGSDAVRNNFLQVLAGTPHNAIFETDAVQAMILAAWQQERIFTWLEIGSCIVMVMALCCSSYGFRHGLLTFATTSLSLAAILHIKKTFDEIVQVSLHLLPGRCQGETKTKRSSKIKRSYITFDNIADIWYIVSGWVAIYRQLIAFPSSLEKPWMAMFCAFSWLRLLYCLRGETWMGPRLLPILSAIKDTFAFFMLMCICLAAAAHAYYNLGVRDEPTPTYAAFMQVIRLGIFGDFDMFEFEGLDPTYALKEDDADQIWEPQDPVPGPDYVWVHALFYIVGLGITVLLMNVLIGVLGANYERYEDRAVGQFFRARVNMLVELQCRPLRNVTKFQDGRLGWISRCFRLLLTTLFVICSPCFLILIALSCIFCQVNGVIYVLLSAFGYFPKGSAAWECQIFFVVREEPDINDVRSLRTELRNRIDAMQETFNTKMETQEKGINAKIENLEKTVGGMNNKIEKHFAEMRELISGQTGQARLTQKDALMEDQIEFKTSPSDPVSPQEVELDPYSRSSQDVSHEETKEVTKLTPKVKKNRKLVPRQTKTSSAPS